MSMLISISTNNSWGRWEAGSHSGSVYELLVAHSVPPIHTGFCSIILAGYWWSKCRWPKDCGNLKNACHPNLSGALWEARQHPSHHSPLQTCKGLPQGRGSNWAPPEKIKYLLQEQKLIKLNMQLFTTCTYKSSLLSHVILTVTLSHGKRQGNFFRRMILVSLKLGKHRNVFYSISSVATQWLLEGSLIFKHTLSVPMCP